MSRLKKFSTTLAIYKVTEIDLDISARTVWAEARGEGKEGMQAVAAVLINRAAKAREFIGAKVGRVRHPLFGNGTLASAAQADWQFSCWNKGDPNRDKLLKLPVSDALYIEAKAAVVWALAEPDPTEGATHYYANWISAPNWVSGATLTKKIGAHLFYKNVN